MLSHEKSLVSKGNKQKHEFLNNFETQSQNMILKRSFLEEWGILPRLEECGSVKG